MCLLQGSKPRLAFSAADSLRWQQRVEALHEERCRQGLELAKEFKADALQRRHLLRRGLAAWHAKHATKVHRFHTAKMPFWAQRADANCLVASYTSQQNVAHFQRTAVVVSVYADCISRLLLGPGETCLARGPKTNSCSVKLAA